MLTENHPELGIDDALRSWCLRELALWLGAKIDSRSIFEAVTEVNRTLKSIFLLDISGHMVRIRDKPEFYQRNELDDPKSPNSAIERANSYRRLVEQTLTCYNLHLHTVIAVDVNDKPHRRLDVPIFGFQKERNSPAILLPDIDFLREDFYQKPVFHDEVPYEGKSTSAIFVGSTSGGGLITKDALRHQSVPRIQSALYFKGSQDVVFRLPAIVQCDSAETEDLIRSFGISGERIPYSEQFHHKFIVSMDGNGATCSRVAVALRSNSVLLKYESPHTLYYFDHLIPWVHYIPIFQDRDVENAVLLERRYPGMFAFIAKASTDFYNRFLTRPGILHYTAMMLETYEKRFPLSEQRKKEGGFADEGSAETAQQARVCDSLVHIQNQGDVWFKAELWNGRRGSCLWIEGFSLHPHERYVAHHLEYQVMFASGTASRWFKCGEFCGSRGQNIPLIGINFRLGGPKTHLYRCSYAAAYVNGVMIGPVEGGQWCSSDDHAALEAFRISITRLPMPHRSNALGRERVARYPTCMKSHLVDNLQFGN